MLKGQNNKSVLLRTFDLPDIHFSAVDGLSQSRLSFHATRTPSDEGLDAIALDRWYEQSKLVEDGKSRRDCWLQIEDEIYVIWGASITSRGKVNNGGDALEQWEFSFAEMKLYRPSSN